MLQPIPCAIATSRTTRYRSERHISRLAGKPGRLATSISCLPRASAMTMRLIGWPTAFTACSSPIDGQRVEAVRGDHEHAAQAFGAGRVCLVDG